MMMANLNGLWDWVGMAPCMRPMSPVCAYSLWAGLCPEKLVKQNKTNIVDNSHAKQTDIIILDCSKAFDTDFFINWRIMVLEATL